MSRTGVLLSPNERHGNKTLKESNWTSERYCRANGHDLRAEVLRAFIQLYHVEWREGVTQRACMPHRCILGLHGNSMATHLVLMFLRNPVNKEDALGSKQWLWTVSTNHHVGARWCCLLYQFCRYQHFFHTIPTKWLGPTNNRPQIETIMAKNNKNNKNLNGPGAMLSSYMISNSLKIIKKICL